MIEKSKALCSGCSDNFYNQPGNSTTGECWLFKGAKVVTRYRLGWWAQPTEPGAFTKVTTLGCHHAPGQYAMYKDLPVFARGVERRPTFEPEPDELAEYRDGDVLYDVALDDSDE